MSQSKPERGQPRIVRLEARIKRLEHVIGVAEHYPNLQDLEREENGPMLSVAQAKEAIGMSDTHLRSMIDDGTIAGVRHGRKYLVPWANLRAYLFSSGVLPLRKGGRGAPGC